MRQGKEAGIPGRREIMTIPTAFRRSATLIGSVVLVSLGASAQADIPETGPVNCATAEGDIRALNAEKEYAKSHELESAAALTPAGALLGLMTGTENKKLEMLSPDYQEHIDARIEKIRTTCGLK